MRETPELDPTRVGIKTPPGDSMGIPLIGLGCATLMRATLPELIEAAARNGFHTITVRPASFVAALEHGLSEHALRRHLCDADVAVRMIDALTGCLPGETTLDPNHPSQRHFPRDVFFPPDEETCLRAAEVLEAPFVNVTCFAQKPVSIERTAEGVGAICRRAASRGVSVALEFIPGTSLSDLVTTDRIARSCGEPNCRVMFDPWHWSGSDGTVADVKALAPGAFAGMQLCDRIPPPPGSAYVPMSDRLMPGEGTLPLIELVRAILANSPLVTIEAEIINRAVHDMAVNDAAAYVAAGLEAWRAHAQCKDQGEPL